MCRKKLTYLMLILYLLALTVETSADPNLLLWYKFDGITGCDFDYSIPDSTGNVEFLKYVDQSDPCAFVRYGPPNTRYNSDGTSADFEPNAGLYRYDPCAPNDIDPLRLAGNQYTIEMWIKIEGFADDHTFVIGKRGSWNIQINDPQGAKQLRWVHDGNQIGQDNTAVEEQWAHIAAIYDHSDESGQRQKFYINGQLIDSGSHEGLNPADNNNPVTIACQELEAGGYGGFYKGLIDELRILDIALNPGQFLLTPGPEWASNPNPYDGQTDIDPNDLDFVLSWTPGSKATTHRVYFSADFQDVNTGSQNAYVGQFPYDTNETNDISLDFGQTYYWRVDEVNTLIWQGVVWSFTTTYPIGDPNLLLWYKFDEAAPNNVAHDSSPRRKHGDVDEDYGNPNWDPEGGFYNGCLVFDNDTGIDVPTDVLADIDDGITVSLWLKDAYQQGWDNNWVFHTGFGDEYEPYHMQVLLDGTTEELLWRAGNDSCDVLTCDWNDLPNPRCWFGGDWHWFIFVKDESQDQISIYFNCGLVASRNDVDNTLVNLRNAPFRIGAATWNHSDLIGKMDDFRIYDHALSQTDIASWCWDLDPLALAWDPDPPCDEVDVPYDANLAWKPGDYAVSHNVYFGTDYDEVTEANTSSSVFKSNYETTGFDLDLLDLDTTYYWRIDEVNDPDIWKGHTWNFTTAEYIVVDDFQSYASEPNFLDYWCDQRCQQPGYVTGSWLTLVAEPNYPVHTPTQAMEYWYDTDSSFPWVNHYAEAWLSFDEPQDWTQGGVKILTLFFYGDPNNDANDTEQMYVGVEDSCGLYAEIRYGDNAEDMNDLKVEQWQQWDTPLPYFNDGNYAAVPNDVHLTDVNRFYIGFGNRWNPVPAGSGVVYFDDIRLYLPVCVPEFGPLADFSDNCIVDMPDIRMMADHWLRHDVYFGSAIQEPNDANLVGWWRLDGDANDSSIYDHNSIVEGSYSWVTGHNDVNVDDLAVEFTGGGGRVLVPDDNKTPELRPKHQVSASAWVYYSITQYVARVVVKGADDMETFNLLIDDQLLFDVSDVNGCRYNVAGNLWHDDWIHIAGTYDGRDVKCYVNGQLQDSRDIGPMPLSQDTSGLAIGSRSDATSREFIGKVDDVRVYNHGLSAAEVAWLATDGTGYIPLLSQANIYDQESPGHKAVNLKDLAALANDWLDKKLWPE